MARFGTSSDALEPRLVDFELPPPPPLLAPVHAASSGRPAMPATPTAAPLSIVRRLGAVPPVGVTADSGAGMKGLLGADGCDADRAASKNTRNSAESNDDVKGSTRSCNI